MNDLKLRIHSDDPRLRRHINHDSRNYRHDVSGRKAATVSWDSPIAGKLNQGDVGDCTSNARTYQLSTSPFFKTLPGQVQASILGSVSSQKWIQGEYSKEEVIDGDGPYPPQDNGSSGPTSAKLSVQEGLISGYTVLGSTNPDDLAKALQDGPASWGTLWKSGMDDVDTKTGLVKYSGATRGGHQILIYKYDAATGLFWAYQSWGPWGFQNLGLFCISAEDMEKSLKDQGDVTFNTPITSPAPTPAPTPVPIGNQDLMTWWNATNPWAHARHVGSNAAAARAAIAYAASQGLS